MSAAETKSTARVTGDPSGIGAIHADRLTRRGFELILIGNQNRLAALAQLPKMRQADQSRRL